LWDLPFEVTENDLKSTISVALNQTPDETYSVLTGNNLVQQIQSSAFPSIDFTKYELTVTVSSNVVPILQDGDIAMLPNCGLISENKSAVFLRTSVGKLNHCLLLSTRAKSSSSSSSSTSSPSVHSQHHVSLRVKMSDVTFYDDQILGRGVSCEVISGIFHGSPVAIKKFHGTISDGNQGNLKSFEKEVAILTMIKHPRIVTFMGAIMEPGIPCCIIFEKLEGETIFDCIDRQDFSLSQRMDCMIQIAKALSFLHSRKVIHRDVKPHNILLEQKNSWNVKLADFGLSTVVDTIMNSNIIRIVGTPQYCAPESINGSRSGISHHQEICKLDVYSFCITLHHVISKQKPYSNCGNAYAVLFAVVGGTRPDPNKLPSSIRSAVIKGWDGDPSKRPTMQNLLSELDPAAAILAKEEQEQTDDESKCVICKDKVKTHILIPCGHLCVCEDDSQRIQLCPLCRQPIQNKYKVYQ